jgi:hypothetical protein
MDAWFDKFKMRYTDEHACSAEDLNILAMIVSGRIADARRERTYYCLGVAILTPFLIAASLFVFFMAIISQFGKGMGHLSAAQMPVLVAAILSLLWVFFMLNQILRFKDHGANIDALGQSFLGIAVLGLLAGFSFQSAWPTIYWLLFGTITVVVLGLMGRGYDVRYRVGSTGDAAQMAATMVVCSALPAALIGLYVKMQELAWLKRGLDTEELLAAALLLLSAACRNTRREDSILRALGREKAERITDALLQLELVERRNLHHILTTDAEKIVQRMGALAWC